MKLVGFEVNGKRRIGILDGGIIAEISGDIFKIGEKTGKKYMLDNVKFLPPVNPKKIICIGFNYRKHMEELRDIATKNPTLTLKSQNSAVGHQDYIIIPEGMGNVEHEGELGIVIKKAGYRIENPKEHILGYTIVNDVTARELEKDMVQWSASKSFPTFCPLGPCIETELDYNNIGIKCRVNGDLRQDSRTSDMIYNAEECVKFVSGFMALERGDLIATGTSGTGKLFAGDIVEIEIEGIGRLKNYVKNGKGMPSM